MVNVQSGSFAFLEHGCETQLNIWNDHFTFLEKEFWKHGTVQFRWTLYPHWKQWKQQGRSPNWCFIIPHDGETFFVTRYQVPREKTLYFKLKNLSQLFRGHNCHCLMLSLSNSLSTTYGTCLLDFFQHFHFLAQKTTKRAKGLQKVEDIQLARCSLREGSLPTEWHSEWVPPPPPPPPPPTPPTYHLVSQLPLCVQCILHFYNSTFLQPSCVCISTT